jgi:D-arabinose 1-dehydrogenase-like Zn-dependent alcohol dehydrogenase
MPPRGQHAGLPLNQALAKSGKIGDIPTQLIRPDQINAAHELLRSGQAHAWQVITWD